MPRPRPPHLHKLTTRHGRTTWVVQMRRGAPKTRLHEKYGTTEFWTEYDKAVRTAPARPVPKVRASAGTLDWAWLSYKDSGAWRALSRATQRQRENIMEHVSKASGTVSITAIDRSDIVDGMDRRSHTPSQAKNFLQTVRGLFKWLVETKKLRVDPTAGISAKRKKTQGFLPWTYDDILKFEKRWPLGTRERVMLDVYAYTGLRRGDAARVGPGHVHTIMRDGVPVKTISLATEKSQGRTMVHLPVLDVLQRTLDAGPTGELSFICKVDGGKYTKESLGNTFKDACVEAGVLNKSAHGLRKAAATRAADNGATAHELMAIFGWLDIKEAEIYTREADRKRLAAKAMDKLEA